MAEPKLQKNGKYLIRVRFKHIITGEWVERQKQFSTKKQCRDWERNVLNEAETTSPDKIMLATYFEEWYVTFKKNTVGPDHRRKIRTTKKYILNFFGKNCKLKDIDRNKYQKWINYLGIEKNLAIETVKAHHQIFKSMLTEALESNLIRQNPTRNITIVGRDASQEKKHTLTADEWNELLKAVLLGEECSSKYATLTMMFIGCRFQEVDGLLISDILFKSDQININKAFDYRVTKEHTKTKTYGSKRVVDMPKPLKAILKNYVTRLQRSQKVIEMNSKNRNIFLFPGDLENIPITNRAINKYLKRKCIIAGIEPVTSHALRHAKTDLLVLAGADLIYIQKQLGHADPSTTLKYYSTLNEEIRTKNYNIQDRFIEQVMQR